MIRAHKPAVPSCALKTGGGAPAALPVALSPVALTSHGHDRRAAAPDRHGVREALGSPCRSLSSRGAR